VRTRHFILRSDCPEEKARNTALQLEMVWAGLVGAAPWRPVHPVERPMQVVLLADEQELKTFVRDGYGGITVRDASGEDPLLFSAAGRSMGLSGVTILQHELAHAFNNAFLLRQPRWFSEGLASYLETAQVENDETTVKVGSVNEPRLRWFLRNPPRFGPMLSRSGLQPPRAESGFELEGFYAQSWLLVHMLINQRRAQLDGYVKALARGEAPERAWNDAFGTLGPADLEAEARAYLAEGALTWVRVKLDGVATEAVVRPLSLAEAPAARAQLYLLTHQSGLGRLPPADAMKAALDEATRALAIEPGNLRAAWVAFLAMNPADPGRLVIARDAVARQPAESRAWTLLAYALQVSGGPAPEHRAAVQKAGQLGPDEVLAQAMLALDSVNRGRGTEALALAQHAVQLAPASPIALDALAVSLSALHRCSEAVATGQRALDMLPDGAPQAAAQELRTRLQRLASGCRETVAGAAGAGHADAAGHGAPEVAPRRSGRCKTRGVVGSPGTKPGTRVSVQYTVDAQGHVSAIEPAPGTPSSIARALAQYLAGCSFEPATNAGQKVEARVTELFVFGAAR
jgi:tetratricopeptide (TPR) repeat protein